MLRERQHWSEEAERQEMTRVPFYTPASQFPRTACIPMSEYLLLACSATSGWPSIQHVRLWGHLRVKLRPSQFINLFKRLCQAQTQGYLFCKLKLFSFFSGCLALAAGGSPGGLHPSAFEQHLIGVWCCTVTQAHLAYFLPSYLGPFIRLPWFFSLENDARNWDLGTEKLGCYEVLVFFSD